MKKNFLIILFIIIVLNGCGLIENQNQLIIYTLNNFKNYFNIDKSAGVNDTLSTNFTYTLNGIIMKERDIALDMINREMSTYTMDIDTSSIEFKEVNDEIAVVDVDVIMLKSEDNTEVRRSTFTFEKKNNILQCLIGSDWKISSWEW